MRKVLLVYFLIVLASIAVNGGAAAQVASFKVCESTYALCTTATCTPVPGKDNAVSCVCEVKTGFSAGQESCQTAEETEDGKQIKSRYFPVRSYAICSNDRPWAWCLDKPCIVDENDPEKASCACTTVRNQGPYVIVTDSYSASTCTTGIISSATVTQIDQITDFLKSESKLRPLDIKVLSGPE